MIGSNNYCWERVKAGAATGGVLGLCIGTLYGLYGVIGYVGFLIITFKCGILINIKYGVLVYPFRLRDVRMGTRMQLLARTVAASAASFGFFLAVGSAIRCDCEPSASSSALLLHKERRDNRTSKQ